MRRGGATMFAAALFLALPAEAATPWQAVERLPLVGARHAPPGWTALGGARRFESADGELEGVFAAGREPARGAGVRGVWRRLRLGPGASAGAMSLDVVVRRGDLRLAAGVERWRWGAFGRLSVRLGATRAFGERLLVSGGCEIFPGEDPGADRAEIALLFGDGMWWGGVRAGPEAGTLASSIGLFVAAGTVVDVTLAGEAPEVGISWRRGAWEIRARGSDHPMLGKTSEFALVLGGGAA